ncbi:DUF2220 family protein [Anaerolineales bacterium HSG6]|nr:DUF2220 family protein [Anaerolineales bacterium HSG6]MDM8530426.1 DUF2220 family protein [Anaerolineales bacterium HSG25]
MLITPTEIRQKAERKYWAYLRAWLTNVPFFPLNIPFRKVKASDDYRTIKTGMEILLRGSKSQQGFGYQVDLQPRSMRQYGTQSLPVSISFETESDYLKLIQKQREVAIFKKNVSLIRANLPQLATWLTDSPKQVIHQAEVWPDLLTVCHYFLQNPRPNLYLRELPIPVHTKFIEEHVGILRELLTEILPPDTINLAETMFEKRFGLRYDEALIRLQVLDNELVKQYSFISSDISLPLSQFSQLNLSQHRFIITENKMNFLTLPAMPHSFGLWGGGFRVKLLKTVPWLTNCPILYWGDLDAQGFQILSQLRGYFPQTESIMMDRATFERFQPFVVSGTPSKVERLAHLTVDEHAMFSHLSSHNLRLEQERIQHGYVVEQFANLALSG